MAWILSMTTLGRTKEIFPKFQCILMNIRNSMSFLMLGKRGPSINSLIVLPFTQLLSQKLNFDLFPTFQQMSCLKIGNPTLIAAQLKEQGSLSGSRESRRC